MPKSSIIIPVFNKWALTRQCLDALSVTTGSDYEVIIVDDASTDETPEMLKQYGESLRVVRHDKNAGFATTCNDGAAIAKGEYFVFLNNDTIPQAGWLQELVDYIERHPAAAAVGSKMLFPDDTIQHAGVSIRQDLYPGHIYNGFPATHPAVNKSRRFQIVTGGCMLVRREAFEWAKGFDPEFHNGFEDVDLCLRLGERGQEIHYCHTSVLYHLESRTRDPNLTLSYHIDNERLYSKRWKYKVRPDDFLYYIEDSLISLQYPPQYPMHLSVSPELAIKGSVDHPEKTDRILQQRSRQVFDLLQENLHLMVHVREAELALAKAAGTATPAVRGRQKVVCKGEIRWRSNEPGRDVISILMPVKNGAEKLKQLLPALESQKTKASVEIIAVDSGSTDESIALLRDAGATVIAISAADFNHGLTRNLAASHARGDALVFINQSTLPMDEMWLENLIQPLRRDAMIAGVCSRVLPGEGADLLTRRDGLGDPNGSAMRTVRQIFKKGELEEMSPHERRLFINFHTMSAAIRRDVFQQIPFREVRMGEDLFWARDVLEAGWKIQHEPSSRIYHHHHYSPLELLQRNFDDGEANRQVVGRQMEAWEILPLASRLLLEDWRYIENECSLSAEQMEEWKAAAALRRAAQVLGQWLGVNAKGGDMAALLSLTERIKAGVPVETKGYASSPG